MTLEVTLRLFVALLLGGIVGIEREFRSKDAGFRTHFLVALGSALFCIVSQYGFGIDLKDSSRVAAQVVSGIGFLGAGTIIFQKNMVRGLTTAAGLWVTAAIGLACGTGMYAAAAIATVMILMGLEVLDALIPQVGTTTVSLTFSAERERQKSGRSDQGRLYRAVFLRTEGSSYLAGRNLRSSAGDESETRQPQRATHRLYG